MITSFDLTIFFAGKYRKEYHNLSRVAVKRYIAHHKQNQDFVDFAVEYHESLISN